MAEFDIGDKVKHKVFGEGTITDIAEGNSANLTIAFGKDKKVIKSSYVKLLKQMFNKIITWWNNFWEWYNNHKIFKRYFNQSTIVRLIIGAVFVMLFSYLMINLVDLIFFGEANW